jgi:hypothetical protein
MARPVKWSRDVHPIRERTLRSKTETWSRQDIEQLFGISRPSAQSLMKAIGEVQVVGGTHFVDRTSLLAFLDDMIRAESVEEGLRMRLEQAVPVARPKTLRVSLPADLRHARMEDLPGSIRLAPGRLEIEADSAEAMCEALMLLATVMQNDLERWRMTIEPLPQASTSDTSLLRLIASMRAPAL